MTDRVIEAKHRLLRFGYSLSSYSPADLAFALLEVGVCHVGFLDGQPTCRHGHVHNLFKTVFCPIISVHPSFAHPTHG